MRPPAVRSRSPVDPWAHRPGWIRRATALLAVLLLGVGARIASPQAPEHAIGLITHETDEASVRLLRAANVRHVKTTLYWSDWVADTAYRTRFAAGIARLHAASLEITVVVHQPPPGYRYAARAQAYGDFAAFVGARAAQFAAVRNWQLWNEQDAPGWTDLFGSGVEPMRRQGQRYAEMLALAYPAIRRARPTARVVVGGLASGDHEAVEFLRGIYDGGGPFDVLAVHAYGPPIRTAAQTRGTLLRAAMRAHADRRPLWLTEFGISGTTMRTLWRVVDPARRDRTQLEQWRTLAVWNDSAAVFDRLVGYVLLDEGDDGYGLVHRDRRTTRPAYDWLRERNR